MIDLVCLVADKNMEAVVNALLQRPVSLGIRIITWEIIRHPGHDPGCYHSAAPFLRSYQRDARYACVLFDKAWDGAPPKSSIELEADVDSHLKQFGAGWSKSIVIDPELEIWLFRRSPRLDEALGWQGAKPSLGEALAAQDLWPTGAEKPADPKAAIEWALRQARKPRSSSIYGSIAAQLGIKGCSDASFGRFQSMLQAWFPPT